MARNYFQDPLETGQDAFDRGFDRQQGVQDRITTTRAGRALADGDQAGAANLFARGGMVPQARQIQSDITAAEDRVTERADAERDRKTKMQAQQAQALVTIAKGLREVPPGQRAAMLKQSLPIFQQIGVDPTPFASLTEDQLTDEQLAVFAGEMEKQYQGVNLGGGGYGRFNDRTGEFKTLREPDPKLRTLSGGATLVDEDGKPIYTAPKTFAPRSGGGRGGGKPKSYTADDVTW